MNSESVHRPFKVTTRKTEKPAIRVIQAESVEHIEQIRTLFVEYAESLGFSLCFQDFDKELAGLPGDYSAPTGCLLLAWADGEMAGCVALRRLADRVCEMKRMYIRPAFRGKGLGRKLAEAVVRRADAMGYRRMRLDTLPVMKEAIELYRSMGFGTIEPYYRNPIEGALYMELDLAEGTRSGGGP